ncbi:MAG: nuclear transport factor 2 family protein [Desulfobacteraceae bacterium]|jgi:ketosteroid isomerase-like protein
MIQNEAAIDSEEWGKFIDMVHASNTEFAKGIVGDVTRAVWSHSDDATIFGGYGGFVEPGWNNVEVRLMTVSKQAANGTYSYKPIKNTITGDSAHILQTEQYIFPGKSAIDIRATIICQKEPEGWKIIHRHGEIINTPL